MRVLSVRYEINNYIGSLKTASGLMKTKYDVIIITFIIFPTLLLNKKTMIFVRPILFSIDQYIINLHVKVENFLQLIVLL